MFYDILRSKPFKALLILFFLAMILNLIVLDIKLFHAQPDNQDTKESRSTINKLSVDNNEPSQDLLNCPNSCLAKIEEATSSLRLNPTTPQVAKTSSQLIKEFFVPLGSGSVSSADWSDVSGAQVYVNSASYGQMKKVVFEPSVHIPTGNQTVYVRLYNVTDKHPVWFSEVSADGGIPQLLFSQPITLDSGNKLYQVQAKTSLKYEAVIDQARIHITSY